MATLFVVATPIGNLQDITLRAKQTLLEVPVIACEDTRHTGQLVKLLGRTLPVKYLSIRDWNESDTIGKIILELVNGQDVALVSDAGTPLISDPGFKLVRTIREADLSIVAIPGPTAAMAALSISGLPTDKFTFLGFNHQDYQFESHHTYILYESPKRINETLKHLRNRYPTATIVLAAELTKVHERVWTWQGEEVLDKGEYTILVNCDQ